MGEAGVVNNIVNKLPEIAAGDGNLMGGRHEMNEAPFIQLHLFIRRYRAIRHQKT